MFASSQLVKSHSSSCSPVSSGQLFALATLLHVLIWTLLPSLLLKNASLDIIEGLAWGHEWQLGYEKDPPLWPWIIESLTASVSRSLWACYLAAQFCIGTVFFAVWRLGNRLTNSREALLGVLLMEGIHYFNYPTPEFNDLVLQMPFAALFGWLLHRALTGNQRLDWCLSGLVAGLGLWARYSMGAYIAAMGLFVLLHPQARRRLAEPGPWLLVLTCLLVFSPHIYWIIDSGFVSISYVGARAPVADTGAQYIVQLLAFLGAQLAAIAAMLALVFLLWRWRSSKPTCVQTAKADPVDFNRAYLAALALGPLAFSLLLSALTQRPPRAMWGGPLMCFVGLLIATTIRPVFTVDRLRYFGRAWLIVLLLPALLFVVEQVCRPLIAGREGRVNYPGQELGLEVTNRWLVGTGMPLKYVIGDTWHAGNVAFYSHDRPSTLFSHGGYRLSPWVSPEKLKQSGAVVVWDALREGLAVPADIRAQFPKAVLQPAILLSRNSSIYKIGVAFLLPESRSPGAPAQMHRSRFDPPPPTP